MQTTCLCGQPIVDIDTAAISRNVVVDVPIVADARLALEKLLGWEPKPHSAKAAGGNILLLFIQLYVLSSPHLVLAYIRHNNAFREAVCLRRRKECPNDCKGPNPACPPYEPEFVKLAESYGACGIRVARQETVSSSVVPTVRLCRL